jgi:hypothetical protein
MCRVSEMFLEVPVFKQSWPSQSAKSRSQLSAVFAPPVRLVARSRGHPPTLARRNRELAAQTSGGRFSLHSRNFALDTKCP